MTTAADILDPLSGPEALHPKYWPVPKGYANGMIGQGRLLVTGGIVGWDETGSFAEGFVAQARQTFENICAILGSRITAASRPCSNSGVGTASSP